MVTTGTVIFGGSFDPITKAHEDIFYNLSLRFNRVIVVPSKISPFKENGSSASEKFRLDMIKLAIPTAEISEFEVSSDSVSYSYKTVEYYKNQGEKIYFALGSEEVSKIDKWKNADFLKENVIFYVITRPFFNFIDDYDRLKKLGFSLEVADFVGLSGSSSELKIDIAFDKNSSIVSENVFAFIKEKQLYRDYKFITDRFNEFKITDKRKEHIYRTALMAVKLAKRYGESVNKAIVAALLHDIGKYTDAADLAAKNIPFNTDISNMTKSVSHAPIGAAIAKYAFKIDDEDIINAIESHTVAGINISALQKIIFIADYIEEGRNFEGVEAIREICFEDIDVGVETVLKATIDYLTENGKTIYHVSKEAWEFYKNLNQNKSRK